MDTSLNVILPGDDKVNKARRVLYLLHPLGGDAASWTRWTAVERYASVYGFAVIMPQVARSFYMDMARGGRFFSYITQELPELVRDLFSLEPPREDTFVAGSSMGGYGALKAALSRPEFYGQCAAFSGAYDLEMVKSMAVVAHGGLRDLADTLGDKLEISDGDKLDVLARQAAHAHKKPRILMCCGDGDFLLAANLHMYRELERLGFDVRYRQWRGGHDWAFWDDAIALACAFFDGHEPPEKPYT